MRTLNDDRGKNWFDVVEKDSGQIDITVTKPGIIRAFHRHQNKNEWIFVIKGRYKFVLTDPKETKYLSEGDVVQVKPNRWHGYQVVGNKNGIVLEYGDRKFDIDNLDDEVEDIYKFDQWKKTK